MNPLEPMETRAALQAQRLHIAHGRLIDPKNAIDAALDLFVADGRIAGVGQTPAGFVAERVIDAQGQMSAPVWSIYRPDWQALNPNWPLQWPAGLPLWPVRPTPTRRSTNPVWSNAWCGAAKSSDWRTFTR